MKKKQTIASLVMVALCSFALGGCKSKFTPLDDEAVAEGLKYSEAHIPKCGDSRFAYYLPAKESKEAPAVLEFKPFAVFSPAAGYTLDEYRKLTEAHGITEADKLNGLEWRGVCSFICESYRANRNGHWSEWKDRNSFQYEFPGIDFMPARKFKGHWEFGDEKSARLEPVPCEQADKLLASTGVERK